MLCFSTISISSIIGSSQVATCFSNINIFNLLVRLLFAMWV